MIELIILSHCDPWINVRISQSEWDSKHERADRGKFR